MGGASEADVKVSRVLEKIAKAKDTLITSVAIAYVMRKTPYVFPICGGRNIKHLKGNIDALSVELSDEDVEAIEDATPFDPGFPLTMLGRGKGGAKGPEDVWLSTMNSVTDHVAKTKAIPPHKAS